MSDVKKQKATDFTPDPANANRGTERGQRMIDDSLAQTGLGRSIVVDKDGRVIAGNKTLQAAVDAGLDDALVIETDGKQLVVVQRSDLDLSDSDPNNRARRLAYYDNRTGQVSLDFDPEQLLADMQAGFDFDALFRADEIEAIIGELEYPKAPEDFPAYDDDIETEYCCPKCNYEWSGSPK